MVEGVLWQCVYTIPTFPFVVLYTVNAAAQIIEIVRLFPRTAAQRQVDTP
jgi:hypothetical protein